MTSCCLLARLGARRFRGKAGKVDQLQFRRSIYDLRLRTRL